MLQSSCRIRERWLPNRQYWDYCRNHFESKAENTRLTDENIYQRIQDAHLSLAEDWVAILSGYGLGQVNLMDCEFAGTTMVSVAIFDSLGNKRLDRIVDYGKSKDQMKQEIPESWSKGSRIVACGVIDKFYRPENEMFHQRSLQLNWLRLICQHI
jgi:hypothetical protein